MKNGAIAAAVLVLSACAGISHQRDDDGAAKEYRTGSNLPIRDRHATNPIQSMDMSLEQVRVPPTMRSFGKND